MSLQQRLPHCFAALAIIAAVSSAAQESDASRSSVLVLDFVGEGVPRALLDTASAAMRRVLAECGMRVTGASRAVPTRRYIYQPSLARLGAVNAADWVVAGTMESVTSGYRLSTNVVPVSADLGQPFEIACPTTAGARLGSAQARMASSIAVRICRAVDDRASARSQPSVDTSPDQPGTPLLGRAESAARERSGARTTGLPLVQFAADAGALTLAASLAMRVAPFAAVGGGIGAAWGFQSSAARRIWYASHWEAFVRLQTNPFGTAFLSVDVGVSHVGYSTTDDDVTPGTFQGFYLAPMVGLHYVRIGTHLRFGTADDQRDGRGSDTIVNPFVLRIVIP